MNFSFLNCSLKKRIKTIFKSVLLFLFGSVEVKMAWEKYIWYQIWLITISNFNSYACNRENMYYYVGRLCLCEGIACIVFKLHNSVAQPPQSGLRKKINLPQLLFDWNDPWINVQFCKGETYIDILFLEFILLGLLCGWAIEFTYFLLFCVLREIDDCKLYRVSSSLLLWLC